MPSRGQGTRLGFPITDHGQGDQVGSIEYGPKGV